MKHALIASAFLLLLVAGFTMTGCDASQGFMEDSNRWVSLPVREGIHPSEAWDVVTNSVITKGFMVESSDRDNLYLRTMWFYEDVDGVTVRSRVTVKIWGGKQGLNVRVFPECNGSIGRCADVPRLYDLIEELTNRLR
jgi:uncharacterized lipoprotein YajG